MAEARPGNQTAADDMTRYVRVRNVIDDRFVEFDFAIGDPSLYVELVLPKEAYEAFCAHNQVVPMSDEQAERVDADMVRWCYGSEHESCGSQPVLTEVR